MTTVRPPVIDLPFSHSVMSPTPKIAPSRVLNQIAWTNTVDKQLHPKLRTLYPL